MLALAAGPTTGRSCPTTTSATTGAAAGRRCARGSPMPTVAGNAAPDAGSPAPRACARATRAAVSAVIALLRQVTEAQRGGVNRSSQLRHLAEWVFAAPDEPAAHALMTAAFNLRTARHLGGAHDDADQISSRATWWDAPGVDISVTLFRRGKAPDAGRTPAGQEQPRGEGRTRPPPGRASARPSAPPPSRCSATARTTGCSTRTRPGSCSACSPWPPRPARSSPAASRPPPAATTC